MRENGREINDAMSDPKINMPDQLKNSVLDFFFNIYYNYFDEHSINYKEFSNENELTSAILIGESSKCVILREKDCCQAIFWIDDNEEENQNLAVIFKYNNEKRTTDITLTIEKDQNDNKKTTISCFGSIDSDDNIDFGVETITCTEDDEIIYIYAKDFDKHGNVINPLCATNYDELYDLLVGQDSKINKYLNSNQSNVRENTSKGQVKKMTPKYEKCD